MLIRIMTKCTSGSERMIHGGGWSYDPVSAQVAIRFWNDPGYRFGYLGLRLILVMR